MYVSHSVTEIEQCCIFIRVYFYLLCIKHFLLFIYKVRGCVVNLVGHGSCIMGHGSVFVWVSGSWVTACDPLFTVVCRSQCSVVCDAVEQPWDDVVTPASASTSQWRWEQRLVYSSVITITTRFLTRALKADVIKPRYDTIRDAILTCARKPT